MFPRQRFERGPHRAIGRDPARDNQRIGFGNREERLASPINHAIDRGLLKRSGNVGVLVNVRLLGPQHRAFQPSEGEMRFCTTQQRTWQRHSAGVALQGDPLDRWTTGKAQSEDLGSLVERFTQRVIDRSRQPPVTSHAFDQQDLAMPARNQQQQIRECQRGIGQPRRKGVAFQMVDRNQRLVAGHRQRFGGDQPDHHPADQPRPGGGGNRIKVGQAQPSFFQHRFDQRGEPFGMGARGNFGDHATIGPVSLILRGNALRQNGAPAVHQRGCGFVARRFNSEDNRHPGFP